MAQSASPFAMITGAFKDLSGKLIREEGIEDVEVAKRRMIQMSPGFAKDPMFHDLFPDCFGIALCEYKIAQRDHNG